MNLAAIEAAARRLDGVVPLSPLVECPALAEACRGEVFLKLESLQAIGSFKQRGAYNLMSQLSAEQAAQGVVAFSSGNHAQGVAAAARDLGLSATIVMPEDAPPAKLANTRRLGGRVVTYDRATGDREAIARDLASRTGAALVPSYDHPDIVAGQGTVGLEIAKQCRQRGVEPDQVLICCGGGGLSAGAAIALRATFPKVAIVTVEPESFDDTSRSLASGERQSNAAGAKSICDALLAETPGELPFDILREQGATGVTVSDDEVRNAQRFAFEHLKLVIEPGGAVAVAALLAGKVATAGLTTIGVVTGGNVDFAAFAATLGDPAVVAAGSGPR